MNGINVLFVVFCFLVVLVYHFLYDMKDICIYMPI